MILDKLKVFMHEKFSLSTIALTGFFALCVLTFFFPYSGDDWSWGSLAGMERLKNGFEYYNGRYASNMLILVLARYKVIRVLFEAATLSALAYAIAYFVGTKERSMYVVALAFFLGAPIEFFAQGVVWASGFVNYVLPALNIIIILTIARNILLDDIGTNESTKAQDNGRASRLSRKETPHIQHVIFLSVLGFMGSLIVENVTIFNLGFSVLMILVLFFKKHEVSKTFVALLASSAIGAVVMFTNSGYSELGAMQTFSDREVYHSLSDIIHHGAFDVLYPLFQGSWILLLCISLASFFLFIKNRNVVFAAVSGILGVLSIGSHIVALDTESTMASILAFSIAIIFILILVRYTLYTIDAFNQRFFGDIEQLRMLGYSAFILLATLFFLVGPLMMLSPVGPRHYYFIYIFEIIVLLITIGALPSFGPMFGVIAGISASILYIHMLVTYVPIYQAFTERTHYIESEIAEGNRIIYVPELDVTPYVWHPNPQANYRWGFEYFYDIPDGSELVVVYKDGSKSDPMSISYNSEKTL